MDPQLALAAVATELQQRAPGLRVEIFSEGPIPVLEVRTPLIPEGVARVHVAYRPDGYVMMAIEPVGGGATGAAAHRRTADAGAVAEAIADWATRPLRVRLPHPAAADELRKRAGNRVKRALADAAAPPPLRSDGELFEAEPALIAFHYPRDRRGRMLTTVKVLVEVLEAGGPGRRSRCRFLRLRDGAFETFVAEEFIENQDHRWHLQPWRWQRTAASRSERWAVADLAAATAAAEQLEAGDVEPAFAAFGVRIGAELHHVLAGEPLGPFGSDLAGKWGTVAAEELAAAAPWRLAALAGKNWTRLFGLGGINAQVKPVVALCLRAGSPTLDVAGSGSNRRLAREDWERPLDFEAHRLGIALAAQLQSE